jgi:hypothetical protein
VASTQQVSVNKVLMLLVLAQNDDVRDPFSHAPTPGPRSRPESG